MIRWGPCTIVVGLFVATSALADVTLVLIDETRVVGVDLARRGGEFHLTTAGGETLVFPIELVRVARVTGDSPGQVHPDGPATTAPTETVPRATATGPADAGSGGRRTTATPPPSEQLAAFERDPASFYNGPIPPVWHYDDVLGEETDVTQFRPSRWYRPPTDPRWRYADVLGEATDITRFRPARWYRPSIRYRWYPEDGWMQRADP